VSITGALPLKASNKFQELEQLKNIPEVRNVSSRLFIFLRVSAITLPLVNMEACYLLEISGYVLAVGYHCSLDA
jgi:hypothetical protein